MHTHLLTPVPLSLSLSLSLSLCMFLLRGRGSPPLFPDQRSSIPACTIHEAGLHVWFTRTGLRPAGSAGSWLAVIKAGLIGCPVCQHGPRSSQTWVLWDCCVQDWRVTRFCSVQGHPVMHKDTDNMPVTSSVDCLLCLIGSFVLLIMWTRPSAPSSSEFTQKMFCVVCVRAFQSLQIQRPPPRQTLSQNRDSQY